ncbi:hypothetical protein L6164_033688 [Bauhinia variegata]|uniref:Uncharacterized protein n=1 Tax=Bauhinia variegata TaxID=167791 RepID=A0ACB9KSL0_BAUVA|nr:hypothetical protein L6164_033688 [Bauhinia variegata]
MDWDEYMRRCSTKKCQRVQVDESFVPALQDDVMEVEHLLAEPRNDHVSVDGILYFHEENLGKCYDIGNLSCGFEFGLKTNIGGLGSPKTQDAKDDLKLEVLDGLLDDVKIDGLHATDAFSGAYEDYLLDFESADKACGRKSGPYGQSVTGNSGSESHSPGLSGSSIGVGGTSESIKQPIAQSECSNDSLDTRVTCDLNGAFRNNPCQPSNGDHMHLSPLDTQHLNELDNDHPSTGSIASHENETVSAEACHTAALREKRFRRPTQRYIEEFSNLRSKEKVSTAATKNKESGTKLHNDLHHIRLRALRKIPDGKTICGTSDVAFPESKIHSRHLKKEELEYDEEPFASESEDEFVTTKRSRKNDRRKHQRMWTLSEVNKLVDGISEYGVGRWTDIKRVLFASTSYRTPIDLRDKWRNLLRASCAQKFNKKQSEKQEPALRSLPLAVLRRVRELANIHPYPRERSSKKSCIGQVGSLSLPSQSSSHSKRNVRRNKCT